MNKANHSQIPLNGFYHTVYTATIAGEEPETRQGDGLVVLNLPLVSYEHC